MKQLLSTLLLFTIWAGTAVAQLKYRESITAPDQKKVDIFRDEYGIPHIKAENELGVYFGQGYCAAQDRLFQMITFWYAAEGRLSELLGSGYVSADIQSRLFVTPVEERLAKFSALPINVRTAFTAYSAGVNAYLLILANDISMNKFDRIPREIAGLAQAGLLTLQDWSPMNSMAISEYLMRRFGQFGGDELSNYQIFIAQGIDALNTTIPVNDTTAFTTIPNSEIGAILPKGDKIQGGSSYRLPQFNFNPNVARDIREFFESAKQQSIKAGVPSKFGSFAVLSGTTKSALGDVMLLGAPQMDQASPNQVAVINEVELSCPTLHVGGASIAGLPFVIIGRNEKVAWSLTSGLADNTDIFVDTIRVTAGGVPEYFHKGQWKQYDARIDTIKITNGSGGFRDSLVLILKNVHGVALGRDVQNNYIFTQNFTYKTGQYQDWDMQTAIYEMNKAGGLSDFENATKKIAMSFNVFYADADQQIKYFFVGNYVDRKNETVDPRLPRLGTGDDDWTTFMTYDNLPKLLNPKQGYLVNWNNKPVKWWVNGDVGWLSTSGVSRDAKVLDGVVNSAVSFNFDTLKAVPFNASRKFPGFQPYAHYDRGTYQHAVQFTKGGEVINDNIFRPGQSGFVNIAGQNDPNFGSLWTTFSQWRFKKQRFGEFNTVSVESDLLISRDALTFTPNPFSSVVVACIEGNQLEYSSVEIYSMNGSKIATLQLASSADGSGMVRWNGVAEDGSLAPNGVYQFRVISAKSIRTGLVVLSR
jgi:acyl-homoserine lactone acylase PvdQ